MLTLVCNKCYGNISINPDAERVTCSHCGAEWLVSSEDNEPALKPLAISKESNYPILSEARLRNIRQKILYLERQIEDSDLYPYKKNPDYEKLSNMEKVLYFILFLFFAVISFLIVITFFPPGKIILFWFGLNLYLLIGLIKMMFGRGYVIFRKYKITEETLRFLYKKLEPEKIKLLEDKINKTYYNKEGLLKLFAENTFSQNDIDKIMKFSKDPPEFIFDKEKQDMNYLKLREMEIQIKDLNQEQNGIKSDLNIPEVEL